MKVRIYVTALIALFVLTALPARAQFDLGARVGYDLEWEGAFIGVEGRFAPQGIGIPIIIAPAIDYYFLGNDVEGVDIDIDQTFLQIDLNALYPFGVDNQSFTPYVGAGLGIAYYSASVDTDVPGLDVDDSTTDLGLNVIGGAVFGTGNLRPFAQARFTLGGSEALSLMGGVLIRLGQ